MKGRTRTATATVVALALVACGNGGGEAQPGAENVAKAQEPRAPAAAANLGSETSLARLTLEPAAAHRLGILTGPIEQRAVERTRSYGGEVVLPPGRHARVLAPFAGTLFAPERRPAPRPGDAVRRGQPLFRIVAAAAADRDVERARLEAEVGAAGERASVAKARKARMATLLAEDAISLRAFEQASADQVEAEAALESARSRRGLLEQAAVDPAGAAVRDALVLPSPLTGVLSRVEAGPGEMVSASAALAEVVDTRQVWVRVPVYVGDLGSVAPAATASVRRLGEPAHTAPRQARPLASPPAADPASATTDLYYELDNSDDPLRPGERIEVTLVVGGTTAGPVVPASALLYDSEGGVWLYEVRGEHVYQRRRVELRAVAGGLALLGRAPAAGTEVVTVGVAELYGSEFGLAAAK